MHAKTRLNTDHPAPAKPNLKAPSLQTQTQHVPCPREKYQTSEPCWETVAEAHHGDEDAERAARELLLQQVKSLGIVRLEVPIKMRRAPE